MNIHMNMCRLIVTSVFMMLVTITINAQCNVCSGATTTLTPTITGGTGPFVHQWTCQNGFTSTSQNATTSFTSSTICTYTNTDANGCIRTQSMAVNIIPQANYTLSKDCNKLILTTVTTNNCTSFNIQRNISGTWTTIATNVTFPYTIPISGSNMQFRAQAIGCTCGTFTSNTVTASIIEIDYDNCLMIPTGGTSPPFTVYRSCDNGVTWSLWNTISNPFWFITDDCCYYAQDGSGNCTVVKCGLTADNCASSCSCGLATNQTTCGMNISWCTTACTTTNWYIEKLIGSTWTTQISGTTGQPPSYSVPSNGTYRARQTCSNGCTYTGVSHTFTSCGVSCSPLPTTVINQNNTCSPTTQLTAVTSNCQGTPSYAWSTGATTQSINISTTGTYNVTVTGCCATSTATRSVTCTNPCSGYSVVVNGATALCTNANTTLTATITGGTAPYIYNWTINGSSAGTGASLVLNGSSYSAGQTLAINLNLTSNNGCVTSDAHSVVTQNCVDCTCTSTGLAHNSTLCQLTWSQCSGYTAVLQRNISGTWTTVSGAVSPFTITTNGTYRVLQSKAGCSDISSNQVVVTCVIDPCICQNAGLALNLSGCVLNWSPTCPSGVTVALQRNILGTWTNVSGAVSPYVVPAGLNGDYRLMFTKSGCTSYTTNAVTVSCAPVECVCSGNLTNNNCSLSWTSCSGYTSVLQLFNSSTNTWSTAATSSPFTSTVNGQYRVLYTKSGCSNYTSNALTVSCNCSDCNATPTLTSSCQVTWPTCSGWTTQLQAFNGSTWSNIAGTSPYQIDKSYHKYRVVYSKPGCSYTSPSVGNFTTEKTTSVFQPLISNTNNDFIIVYRAEVYYCDTTGFGENDVIFEHIPNDPNNAYTYWTNPNGVGGCVNLGLNTNTRAQMITAINNYFSSNFFTNQITLVGNELKMSINPTDDYLQHVLIRIYYLVNTNVQSCEAGTLYHVDIVLSQCLYCV